MKFAAAVGSAGYHHFTELNVCALRRVFGNDLPIVITDDLSVDSHKVAEVAAKRDCYYKRSDVPLGHFAGDVQTFLDALALAEVEEADVAIKMSQRCIVAHPDLRGIIEGRFSSNENLAMVLPGRPNPNLIRVGHQQFARFPILTDMVFMRTSAMKPETIKEEYEKQVQNGKAYHDCFVEVFVDRLRTGPLNGRVELLEIITNHKGGIKPYYLRRYQNRPEEYAQLADMFGIKRTGVWELGERHKLQRRYDPRPKL